MVGLARPSLDKVKIAQLMENARSENEIEAAYERVKQLHGDRWRRHFAQEYGEVTAYSSRAPDRMADRTRRLEDIRTKEAALNETQQNLEITGADNQREWTLSARLIVIGLSIAILILWTISVNVIAGYLINSGDIQYLPPNEWKAYLISALPLVFPIVLEVAYIALPTSKKRIFFYAMLALTGLGALVWLGTLLVANAPTAIDPYGDASNSAPASIGIWKSVNSGAQIFAELTASFVLISQIMRIWDTHRLTTYRENPLHTQLMSQVKQAREDLRSWEGRTADEDGRISATENFLADGLSEFCGEARAFAETCINKIS